MNTRFDPELSRLAFEDRLLEFCEDPRVPLLERVRLLAITADRLDVFFMTRVGRLKRLAASGEVDDATARSAVEQQQMVAVEAHRVTRRAYRLLEDMLPALAANGVMIDRWESVADEDREFLRRACEERLATLLRPIVVEPSQLFPHVRNLRPALVAAARRRADAAECMLVIELPAELPRLVPLANGRRFVPLEQIIAAGLSDLCPEMDVAAAHLFRVTRNADTDYSAEDDDVLESVEQQIVWRPFQDVVRLEVERDMPVAMRERLLEELQREAGTPGPGLHDRDTYVIDGVMDLTALERLAGLDLPHLTRAPVARRPKRVDHLLEWSAAGDELLHFPFDDYETSLERLLSEAARHPDLESIQTTIYRTDRDSDVVAALRTARARGAEVNAVVEVKASFDEQDNIDLTRALEADGVRVVLSPATLKVHAKTALVTLRRGDERRRVALIGTGNMNAVTARSYVDLWLVTSSDACTIEVAALFDVFTNGERPAEFRRLLVSPFGLRRRFLSLIDREVLHAGAGRPSGIRAMMNGLTDSTIIGALHRASQAGVPIDLMVRGVCLLRPGAPDVSENIRIVSVAGHLLQHARIFHFRNGGADEYFIGSADWRPRNFDRRIEVVTPVEQTDHRATLDRILTDTLGARDAWVLGADGVYVRGGRPGRETADQGSRTYVTLTPS